MRSNVFDRSQRGQVLVMFAGGLVVFLAIVALVVDVGFIWMTRRHQQNAVDPGAVAAARYIRPTADFIKMREAACFYAQQNGFFSLATSLDQCDAAHDTAGATLVVNYPPSPSAGQYAGRSGYVEVAISQPQNAFFAGVVGIGRFTVSTSAVAAYDVGNSNSASLMALNATNCPQGGGTITGGANVSIFLATGVTGPGGYVQVNSNCHTGTPDNVCATGSGQGGLNVNGTSSLSAPQTYVVGTCTGGGTLPGPLTEGANYVGDPLAGLRAPPFPTGGTSCAPGNKLTTAGGAEGCNLHGTVTLDPGTYYGGWNITQPSTQITLNPGIYVIAGGGIKQTGGTLSSAGGRVLIFSTDDPQYAAACKAGTASQQNSQCQGNLNLGGATTLNLTGLDRNSPCPPASIAGATGCPLGGLLIWQDGHASNPAAPVSIEGTTSLFLSGTIYAPGALVTITGNSVTTGCTATGVNFDCVAVQIISDTWKMAGGVNVQMPYDPRVLYQLPLKGLVR
jgi:Putative Flp pilus-assembly TadE/G-like